MCTRKFRAAPDFNCFLQKADGSDTFRGRRNGVHDMKFRVGPDLKCLLQKARGGGVGGGTTKYPT